MDSKNFISKIILILAVISLVMAVFSLTKDKPNTSVQKENIKNVTNKFKLFNSDRKGISIIKIFGPISYTNQTELFGLYKTGAANTIESLKTVGEMDNVKAVVLQINSPGGTMGASQEIYDAIIKLKKKKPVVVSMADMAASGGYYISTPANVIVANPGTITGSIGVFMGNINFSELFKKIGLKMNIIKSDKHKDILSPYRESSDTEIRILQKTIKIVFSQFKDVVLKNRKQFLKKDKFDIIFDGRIFSGQQAKELGLIDELGGLSVAVKIAGELAGIKGEPDIIQLGNKYKILKFFENSANSYTPLKKIFDYTTVPFQYLYQP